MQPILTRNVNGNVTLTFKIYSKYFDTDEGEYVENPFIKLLMVERVLKLKYKDKWYDLVIKNRQESSDQKTYSYTAKSLHINELSKSGYNLEFKAELENNQGNVYELGSAIVEGTEWEIDEEGSELPKAYQDDQLYLCHTTKVIKGTKMLDSSERTITADSYFYVFYNELAKQPNEEFQILYIPNCTDNNLENYILEGNFFDSDGRIIEKDIRGNTIAENILLPAGIKINKDKISNYRGRRLVKQQRCKYNPVLERYVNVYNAGVVEGYTKTKFLTPEFVQNLIVNSKDFTSTSGWYADVGAGNSFASIELDFYPSITSEWKQNTKQSSRIKMTAGKVGQIVYNTAIKANFSKIEEFKPDDIYILRYKFVNEENSPVDIEDGITFQFSKNSTKIEGITIGEAAGKGEGYYEREISFSDTMIKDFLKEARFELVLKDTNSYYLSEMELFKKVIGKKKKQKEDGSEETITEMLYPGDVPVTEPITENFYYNVEDNKDKISAEDYKYLPSNKSYTPVYNDTNYEKIASIDKSESNRFNLIQELCEVFECWANFIIDHDENGAITSKKIQFKEYTGETKWAGFKYGINLKSIQRTVDSEQIVTKTIVKANSNEHGENGYCSIDRAADNPIKQSYILNFDYYLNQGLLSREELNKDLYENFTYDGEEKGKGFYTLLQEKGENISRLQEERLTTSSEYLKGMALLRTAQEIVEATTQELNELKAEYKQYSGLEYPTFPDDAFDNKGEIKDKKVAEFFTKIKRLSQEQEAAKEDESKYQEYTQENYDEKIKEYEDSIANENVAELNNLFFTKYRNFISEGSWSSEEYWDDNLYYMDALDVSRTSSKPKISYTINVIDVSPMEGYEGYEVDVGDKTFIEDPEFFGYTTFVGNDKLIYKQPYKEEIVITEIVEHLESPESNQIKVQNYKTQFDDLFQRITAQTQSLQYASGGYNRASAAFNDDGTLDGNILQNSILSYGLTLLNPENEGIVWDKNGIRIIDRRNTNRIIKLSEGKISLTSDGGQNWNTGISAEGISAELITTGTLNTNNILIGNSEDFSFRWDKIGLNAYYKEKNSSSYNYGKFVRFDKYGLYGYSKGEYFEPNSEQDVKENADFGLTWDGFFLRSKAREGWVEIDSENDFRVLIGTPNNYKEKIKIGEISKGIFGITIKDAAGNDAFYTDDNGDLTLIGHIEANSGSFSGHIDAQSGTIGDWQIYNGNIVSAQSETEYGTQGIILDAKNSQIYSAQYKTSLGMDGWSINNDEAIFNNITLRGALKCAVLEYGEVQAVGGILMIRPSTTIKDYQFVENDTKLVLEVENAFLFRVDDWVKIASNPQDNNEKPYLTDVNGNVVTYSGINTNLLKCLAVREEIKVDQVTGEEVNVGIVELDLTEIDEASGTVLNDLKNLPLKGMGIISLGTPSTRVDGISQYNGSIGISLNSSSNDAIVPQTSFSMFTFEERKKLVGNGTWKYLKPHIILGKIPNESIYDPEIRNKYGLYADAAEITGTIRAKTLILGEGVSIPQNKINGLGETLKNMSDATNTAKNAADEAKASIINENLLIVSDANIFGTLATDEIRQEVKKYWIVASSRDVVGTKSNSATEEILTIELNSEGAEYDFGLNYLGEDTYVYLNTARADVLPNTEYTFSFDGYLGDNANSCRVTTYYDPKNRKELSYNDNSFDLGSDSANVLTSTNQGKWEKAKFTFTTPNNCHSVWFRIRLTPTDASIACSMWFKKLKLERGSLITSYIPSPYDPIFQDALLGNGCVLRTDDSGKLLDSFAPKVNISEIEGDSNNVNITFDGESISYKVPKNGLIVADNMVTKGTVISSQGIIGGWTVGGGKIYATKEVTETIDGVSTKIDKICAVQAGGTWCFAAGSYKNADNIHGSYANCEFRVNHKGELYATKATIEGNITATSGKIGGLQIQYQEQYTEEGLGTINGYTYLSDTSGYFRIAPEGMGFGWGNTVDISPNNRIFMTLGVPGDNPFFSYMNHTLRLGITNDTDIYGYKSDFAYLQLRGDADIDYLEATIANIGTIDSLLCLMHGARFENELASGEISSAKVIIDYHGITQYDSSRNQIFGTNTYGLTIYDGFSLTLNSGSKLVLKGNIDNSSNAAFVQGFKIGGVKKQTLGFLKIYSSEASGYQTPYIDFHYAGSTADFTSRIIENRSGGIDIIGSGGAYILTNTSFNNDETDSKQALFLTCPSGGSVVLSNGVTHTESTTWSKASLRLIAGGSAGGKLYGTWTSSSFAAASSDKRIKNSIENLEEKYSTFFDILTPIRFKYNHGTSNRFHTGFIAQQVEEAVLQSELDSLDFGGFIREIETETDPITNEEIQVERCYLRYEEFIALNTNEIQKLKKRVAELEAQLARLMATT